MYNKGIVITSVLIFLICALTPFWYSRIMGKGSDAPEFKVPGGARQCVETASYMRSKHMKLLHVWREAAVRKGLRTYTASDGKTYEISLTNTCIKCHSNKEEFCDRCHNYEAVKPKCWDCHVYEQKAQGLGQ